MERESDGNEKSTNWVSFDESQDRRGRRSSVVLDVDGPDQEIIDIEESDAQPPPITPLPTEMIADPSKLGQIPELTASQHEEYRNGKVVNSVHQVKTTSNGNGFPLKNGKVVATVYPENSMCAWVVPPRYNPFNVPAVLAAGVTLPAEDFVTAMELITNDYRFRAYSTLYGRVIALWMTFSLLVLIAVLCSSPQGGLPVFIFCIIWCATLIGGIVGCAIIRKQIRIGLRHCVHSANKVLTRHGFLAGVEDRGQISCHKVVIQIMYFDTTDCLHDIERLIRIEASGGAVIGGEGGPGLHSSKDISKEQVEERARNLVLKYSQGFVKDTCRNRTLFPSKPAHGVSDMLPKHCAKLLCVCQYVEKKHFNRKPKKWHEYLV